MSSGLGITTVQLELVNKHCVGIGGSHRGRQIECMADSPTVVCSMIDDMKQNLGWCHRSPKAIDKGKAQCLVSLIGSQVRGIG